MKVIAYHGTCQEFDEFKLPEDLPVSHINFSKGYLGLYFSESKEIAKMFCKEKWYIRNSKYKPNSKLIKVELNMVNPRIVYPIEHARGGQEKMSLLTYRYFLSEHYLHDSLIIDTKKPEEMFACSLDRVKLPWKCEYSARQYVLFSTNGIVIKNVKPLN